MRPILLCIGCAATYLPAPAFPYSTAHCSDPACETVVRQAVAMSGLPEEKLGELARRAAGLEGEPRRGRTRYRPVHGKRAAAAPGGGRGKLR
ncbi:hypothetical protein [Streptomyces sp. NPDC004376]